MPHERRIEQRRRFERIFLGEVRTKKQLTVFAKRSIREEVVIEVFKPSLEEFLGFLVPPVEFFKHLSELVIDLFFRQHADAPDDTQHTLVAGRLEWSQDDALFVGRENESGSFDVHELIVSWWIFPKVTIA